MVDVIDAARRLPDLIWACSRWSTFSSMAWFVIVCAVTGSAIGYSRVATASEPIASNAERLEFEVRLVWGGGPNRYFNGTISVERGSMELIRNLGVQEDSVGSLRATSPSEIAIASRTASNFGGADLILRGSPDSELIFKFTPLAGDKSSPSGNAVPQPIRMALGRLLRDREMHSLDADGSRLAVERLVHDRLRVKVQQDQRIYAPNEKVTLTAEGYRTGLPGGEYRLNARLLESGSERSLGHWQQDVEIDEAGNFKAITFREIDAPSRGGAYSIELSLQRRRLLNSFLSAVNSEERKFDFVVVEQSPPTSGSTAWRELAQIYPAGASWWDSLGKFRMPSVKTLTPLVAHVAKPLSSGEHRRRVVGTHECMVLGKGAWQAFPLSLSGVGAPHRLRIQVPADAPQKLVFSLQESSPASDPAGLRPDSGLIIDPATISNGQLTSHELLFWPRSTQPYLLVLNADPTRDAALAEISLEVAEGGSLTSPMHDAARADAAKADSARANSLSTSFATPESTVPLTRLCSLYFDKPLLAENFGADRTLESKGRRELDSWQTAYQACTRLADYTQWSGHNAVTLTVATQGGAIYPSQHLKPSPKFDSGTFLTNGSSVEIKDQVELLCREFDRRGLRLILALDLEGVLPTLQRFEDASSNDSALYQIPYADLATPADASNASGSASPTVSASAGSTVRYNPLDSRVQQAIEQIVHELSERYGKHASFAGIQLNLSERTHVNFAGDLWGYDKASLQRFEKSLGSSLPSARDKNSADKRSKLLGGTLRLNFARDRAEQLAGFYGRLAEVVCRSRSDARLVINPAKLLSSPPTSDRFANVESQTISPSEVLMSCGVDCARLAMFDKLCVLRPEFDSPMRAPISRAWSYQVASDSQIDSCMACSYAGAMLQQLPSSFRLPDFDRVNPLAGDKSRVWLFPHASYSGAAARREICNRLYRGDTWLLTHGGWLAAMGQENSLRPLLQLLTRLPAASLQDVPTPLASSTFRLRQVVHEGKTYLQLINNSSWSEKLQVELRAERELNVEDLSSGGASQRQLFTGQTVPLAITIEPYSLAGWCIDGTEVKIVRVTSEHEAGLAEKIERRLNELQACINRAGELNEQQTLGLRGGDFEQWNSEGQPIGWSVSTQPNTSITEEHELPRSGNSCLRIENKGNGTATAWVQSDKIAIPSTGRLALEAWVRTAPGQPQPVVRLSLIGLTRDGKRFQRWHEFQSQGRDGNQIPVDWGHRPLVLLVPDVPNESLTELKVAIDLITPGIVWLDDCRVYGIYLHPEEKVHLLGQMFLAKEQMRKGDFALAEQLLESFWANFLTSYLTPAPTTLETDRPTATGPAAAAAAEVKSRFPAATPAWRSSSQPKPGSWYENLRGRWR